jgi:hypothetical protein
VRDAVHLDEVHRAVHRGEYAIRAPLDDKPRAVRAEPVDGGVDDVRRAVARHRHPEPLRADARHRDLVAVPAQFEIDRTGHAVLHLRTSAARGLEQPAHLDLLVVLVRLDARCDERDAGVPVRDQSALRTHPIDPARVGTRVEHLGLVEQIEDEALVRRTALDDDRGLGDRTPEAGQRLVAGAPGRDDLRDHRVEVGRDGVAFADARVDPDAWAAGQFEQLDPSG